MKTNTNSTEYELGIQRAIGEATRHLEFIQTNRKLLDSLPKANFWLDHCDFDNLNRPDLLKVLKAFPGKWSKTIAFSGAGIDYVLEEPVNNLRIRAYNGEPPPSCTIEERIEYVVVPERVERKVIRTIKCPENNHE